MSLAFSFPEPNKLVINFDDVPSGTPRRALYPLVAQAIDWTRDWLVTYPRMKAVIESSDFIAGNRFEVCFKLAPRVRPNRYI